METVEVRTSDMGPTIVIEHLVAREPDV
jgi:hypothetical protein